MVQRIWMGKEFGFSKLEENCLAVLAVLVSVGLGTAGIWYVADRWSELSADGRVSGVGLLLAATAAIAAVVAVLTEVRIDADRRAREATAAAAAVGPEIASRIPDYFDMFKETMKAWVQVQGTYGHDYVPKKINFPDFGYAKPFKVYPPSREAFVAASPILGALSSAQLNKALAADKLARKTSHFATRRDATVDQLPADHYRRYAEHFCVAIETSIAASKSLNAHEDLASACRDAEIAAHRYVDFRKASPALYDRIQSLLEQNASFERAERKSN